MWKCSLVFITLFLANLFSYAESNPTTVDSIKIKFSNESLFEVGERWSDATRSSLVDGEKVTRMDKIRDIINGSPIASWLTFPLNRTSPFKVMGREIAAFCKKTHFPDVMKAISCVANSINETFQPVTDWPTLSSPCKAHTAAFRYTFGLLEIPRSNAFDLDASASDAKHVVIRFTLTSVTGIPFSYVIDVLNAPEKIFPNTTITENWYKKTNRKNPVHPIFF